MTTDQPDARTLIDTARRVLAEEILPVTPEEKKLELLMIRKVLELAARTLDESDDALEVRQRARLESLLGVGGDAATLAAQIRDGAWDSSADARRLHSVLTEDTRDRLARINPKYLRLVETDE